MELPVTVTRMAPEVTRMAPERKRAPVDTRATRLNSS
jgi:hypothetical protein